MRLVCHFPPLFSKKPYSLGNLQWCKPDYEYVHILTALGACHLSCNHMTLFRQADVAPCAIPWRVPRLSISSAATIPRITFIPPCSIEASRTVTAHFVRQFDETAHDHGWNRFNPQHRTEVVHRWYGFPRFKRDFEKPLPICDWVQWRGWISSSTQQCPVKNLH